MPIINTIKNLIVAGCTSVTKYFIGSYLFTRLLKRYAVVKKLTQQMAIELATKNDSYFGYAFDYVNKNDTILAYILDYFDFDLVFGYAFDYVNKNDTILAYVLGYFDPESNSLGFILEWFDLYGIFRSNGLTFLFCSSVAINLLGFVAMTSGLKIGKILVYVYFSWKKKTSIGVETVEVVLTWESWYGAF